MHNTSSAVSSDSAFPSSDTTRLRVSSCGVRSRRPYPRPKSPPPARAALTATRKTFRNCQIFYGQVLRVRTNNRLLWETSGCCTFVFRRGAYHRHSFLHIGVRFISALRCSSVHSDE